MVEAELRALLDRSTDLHAAFHKILEGHGVYDLGDAKVPMTLCVLSMEHAHGIWGLAELESNVSALCLIRLQFEALVRAMWVWECASEQQIERLTAKLSEQSLQAAKNLPSINEMLKALERNPNVHPRATEILLDMKEGLMAELNSFIHAGMMPYTLVSSGVPQIVMIKSIKNSNAISTVTAMLMTQLIGDTTAMKAISKIQPQFADCLPPLIKPNN